jgi:hypothetical protein
VTTSIPTFCSKTNVIPQIAWIRLSKIEIRPSKTLKIPRVRIIQELAFSSSHLVCLVKWREMERVAIEEQQRHQLLRNENSRLEQVWRDARRANSGSTVELEDEPSRKRSREQI